MDLFGTPRECNLVVASFWKLRGTECADGYTLKDGTTFNVLDKGQKWIGINNTFKF